MPTSPSFDPAMEELNEIVFNFFPTQLIGGGLAAIYNIPHTHEGRIDPHFWQIKAYAPGGEPRNSIDLILLNLCFRNTASKTTSIFDNFIELGGQRDQATTYFTMLQSVFHGIEPYLQRFLENPTICELTDILLSHNGVTDDPATIASIVLITSYINWEEDPLNTETQKALSLYSNFIKPGDLCFDVGANFGARTEIFLALGARVVAIEPQSLCRRYLKSVYGSNAFVTVIGKALGDKCGQAEMMTCNMFTTTSSLSKEWMNRANTHEKFEWNTSEIVEVTTLDVLIKEFGMPAFIKIDVEGYELEVLHGLSQPVKALSFEFTPSMSDLSSQCIEYLTTLGEIELNASLVETFELLLPKWVKPAEMIELLSKYAGNSEGYGDVYVRFINL